MKLIIGTGGCGFQRINDLFNRLGYSTLYKTSPVKMQNSKQVIYSDFIFNAQNFKGILIGSFYLNLLENFIEKDNKTKIICLKGDKKKTVESLFIHFGFRNPLILNRDKYSRYNLDFFTNYSENTNISNIEIIEKYYDDYYNKCDELKSKYPNNIFIVGSKEYFENEEYQKKCNSFFDIQNTIIEDKFFINDELEITTSFHGGLGNNLFQMIEPIIYSKINNLPIPIFTTWDCSDLPSCNNADVILGGHGGTIEDFKNSFKNIVFIKPKKANFDTKFVINDMFDFGILTKYRSLILEKFAPSDNILDYINMKYCDLFIDSCSLHIRTWTSKGDVHSMPLNSDYYVKALSIVESKNILVFTDNINNCENILTGLKNTFRDKIFHLIDENQFVSLFMISMCDKNIVNISTFSFWGAFLNKKQDNNIIIPHNFGHEPNMLGDVNWIRI